MLVQKKPLITHKPDTIQNELAHLSWKIPRQQHTLNGNSEQEEMFKAIKKIKKKKGLI